MAIKKFSSKYEAAWSDANQQLLCLDTGTWRTKRPVVNVEKCTYCGLCAIYCPPQCMKIMPDHFEPDLNFCKGCGVCAKECLRGAITMMPEGDFDNEGKKG